MKIVFLLLSLLFLNTIHANIPDFEKIQCRGVIKEFFSKNTQEFGEWRKILPDSFEYEGFRFYPFNPSMWSEIQISSKDNIIRVYDGVDLKEAVIKSDCHLILQKINFPNEIIKNAKADLDFDDQKLLNLLKTQNKNKAAVFYLWSPKFSYSVVHYPYVEKYAKELGVDFIPLLDSRADRDESKRALTVSYKEFWSKNSFKHRSLANTENVQKSFSLDFYLRFGFSHYPISFIAANGKIHSRWVTGVMTEKGFKKQVQKYIKGLK